MKNAKNPSNSTVISDLLAEWTALERRVREARALEYVGAVEEVRRTIREFGIPLSAVRGAFRKLSRADMRAGDEPRYRHPETGKTWSGRGRPPQWIAGKDRKDFLI